jgi:glycosyltransferase involved in cell wall biosynthesis
MRRVVIVEYMMSAGGVERVLRGLARAFLELPEARDWDITFLLSRFNSAHRRCEWPEALLGPNVHVEWLGEHTAASRWLDPLAHAQGFERFPLTKMPGFAAARLARRLGPLWWRAWLGDPHALIGGATERFDLAYFTYPVLMSPPRMRVPVVITPQDFNYKHFYAEGSRSYALHERPTRAWLARADRVLLTTQAVADELQRYYPEHAHKAEVVHLGVDAEAAVPPAPAEVDAVRQRWGLPQGFVLMAGWVMAHKNQLALVRAMALLRERGLQLPVVFVGPNARNLVEARDPGFPEGYAGEVRQALADHGFVHGRDFFALGFVSDAEIRCLYHLAAVFVLPSLYEGFGLPSLEAMQARCPTIVSAIPPLEEQNRTLGGVLRTFDPKDPAALADQIAWTVARREEAARTASVAADRVRDAYDWKKTARAYLAAFEAVLRTAPPAGQRARRRGA